MQKWGVGEDLGPLQTAGDKDKQHPDVVIRLRKKTQPCHHVLEAQDRASGVLHTFLLKHSSVKENSCRLVY